MKMKRRPERIAMRVAKGCLRPADVTSEAMLRARGYRVGDLVFAELKKPRNPGFHRLAHQLGTLTVENLDEFTGMDPHAALKRLQMESGIGCEEIAYKVHGMTIVQRIPISLSFESMEQGEFEQVYRGMCRHLATTYWPSLSADEVAQMAELMPGDAWS